MPNANDHRIGYDEMAHAMRVLEPGVGLPDVPAADEPERAFQMAGLSYARTHAGDFRWLPFGDIQDLGETNRPAPLPVDDPRERHRRESRCNPDGYQCGRCLDAERAELAALTQEQRERHARREADGRRRRQRAAVQSAAVLNKGKDKEVGLIPSLCPCRPCRAKRGENVTLYEDEVHSYSACPPDGWQGQHLDHEMIGRLPPDRRAGWFVDRRTGHEEYREALRFEGPVIRPFYLGVELETTDTQSPPREQYNGRGEYIGSDENGYVTNEQAAAMARPEEFWLPKHDGSVSGPEFASQPASLAWWHAHLPDLDEMFRDLLHAGYRSHEGDEAGMHINISRTAFADRDHLARFCELVYVNTTWALKMSQRTAESANEWAKLIPLKDRRRREQWVTEAWDNGNNMHGRYTALNVPDMERFEFRLPRGTLRLDRFMMKLEWTHGMIEYTRDAGNKPTPPAFMAWVLRHKAEEYPYLNLYIIEKFAAQLRKAA